MTGDPHPVIGICTAVEQARWGAWDMPSYLLPRNYVDAIQRGGGLALMLPPDPRVTEHPDQVLDLLDGLILAGGQDVDPSTYGAERHPTTDPGSLERDEFEMALARRALERDIPFLGICRGMQVMNVAFGGTLVQDIPTQLPGALEHSLPCPPHQAFTFAHEVWIEKDSLLATLMRERLTDDTCEVNSRHHQAVKDVARGFKVSATAPDGVVEAIEDPAALFCLGVQWHPENFFRTGEFRPLFEGFLEASQKR
jgi:putative glutamine amidotransferase